MPCATRRDAGRTVWRGASLAAIRGLTTFYLDLIDTPEIEAAASAEVNKLHLEVRSARAIASTVE